MNSPRSFDVSLRWFQTRDLPRILEIERQAFEDPWSEEDFDRLLWQSRSEHLCRVAVQDDGRLVGYIVYQLHRRWMQILSMVVATDWRRQGIGGLLVRELTGKLVPGRRDRVECGVCETNLAAQVFFRSLGFRAVSILRDFYEFCDCNQDAYRMCYRCQTTTGRPVNRVAPLLT